VLSDFEYQTAGVILDFQSVENFWEFTFLEDNVNDGTNNLTDFTMAWELSGFFHDVTHFFFLVLVFQGQLLVGSQSCVEKLGLGFLQFESRLGFFQTVFFDFLVGKAGSENKTFVMLVTEQTRSGESGLFNKVRFELVSEKSATSSGKKHACQ